MKELKYISDGLYFVFAGKTLIARSYKGQHGYAIGILQGMDRAKTIAKIVEDCPEFASNNGIGLNHYPKLFSPPSKSEMVQIREQYKKLVDSRKAPKVYTKTHLNTKAAANHIDKIEKRGGEVEKKPRKSMGVVLKYTFDKKGIFNSKNLLPYERTQIVEAFRRAKGLKELVQEENKNALVELSNQTGFKKTFLEKHMDEIKQM